jgi:hypothetical protein
MFHTEGTVVGAMLTKSFKLCCVSVSHSLKAKLIHASVTHKATALLKINLQYRVLLLLLLLLELVT